MAKGQSSAPSPLKCESRPAPAMDSAFELRVKAMPGCTAVQPETSTSLSVPVTIPCSIARAMTSTTQSGQKLRLREKGVPSATKEGRRGDEIVEIKVTVPMPRDEKTKELLRELAKLNPEDPRTELFKN